jgi:hypothetical protein
LIGITSRQPAVIQRDLKLEDVRDLWLGMLRRPWKSLALVPAAPGGFIPGSALAKALCDLGALYRGRPLPLLSASNLTLDQVTQFIDTMKRLEKATNGQDQEHRAIVVLESVITNPLGIAVALAVDAVLLVVELGKSDERSAQRTIELIGRDRFIGSVALK